MLRKWRFTPRLAPSQLLNSTRGCSTRSGLKSLMTDAWTASFPQEGNALNVR